MATEKIQQSEKILSFYYSQTHADKDDQVVRQCLLRDGKTIRKFTHATAPGEDVSPYEQEFRDVKHVGYGHELIGV